MNGKCSAKSFLSWGVPQGSVLVPLLFWIYTLPLGRLVMKYGLDLDLHIYVDDTQLYICIRPASQRALGDAVSKIQTCVKHVEHWMTTNMLKAEQWQARDIAAQLSKVKLDTYVYRDWQHTRPYLLWTGAQSRSDVWQEPVMAARVSSLIKSTNFHMSNIRKIRKLLTEGAASKLVTSLVLSRLD